MDSRAVLHPVGPLPPGVYWRRRAFAAAVVLVLVIAVAVSCSGGSPGNKHPGTTTRPTTPVSSPPASTPASLAACSRGALTVTASTDAATYPAGVEPHLLVTIRNTGTTACRLTESPSTRTWTIRSGPDTVWTTAGCAASHVATAATLAVHGVRRHALVWNRHRSGAACATSPTLAQPGTYQLVVTIAGVSSAPAVFHLSG